MYFQQQEECISEPADEISESSYIKINKRFLQELKQTNQVDDLSRYRQQSDDEEQTKLSNQQKTSANIYEQNFMSLTKSYENSPIRSKFYKDIVEVENTHQERQNNNSNKKFSVSGKNHTPEKKQQQMKLSQKIAKLNHFAQKKKQSITPQDNTLEYYLLRKSHDRKQRENQILKSEHNSYSNDINEIQTKNIFSPKHQVSSSNRVQNNSQKTELERINYKKLLQSEIIKNKQLQRQVYKLESKLAHLTVQYEQSTKCTKKLQKEVNNVNKIRKQNKNRMKQLDLKLEGFKNICRVKNMQKDHLMIEVKKENKILRQENQKYRIFTETLAESIFVLKGKKPKNIEDIWSQWKDIFESFSKNKWSLTKIKSPNKKA